MWADINTKSKQGLPFRIDRSQMMNCDMDLTKEEIDGDMVDKNTVPGDTSENEEMEPPYPKDEGRTQMSTSISKGSV